MTIITEHVNPPVPTPAWDWSAHFEGAEDGPIGRGPDEVTAIMDLMNNLEDDE